MRLCFVGDPDSIHVQRWAGHFAGRGHEVHLVSFYPPRAPLEGVRTHALYSRPPESWLWRRVAGRGEGTGGGRWRPQWGAYGRVPPSLARLVTWLRYRWQGIERLVGDIRPDILHGHYITDYALYATAARFHPFVATAWGSDILIAAQGSPPGRAIARYVLGKADLITADSDQVIARMRELGGAQKEIVKIVLGVDRSFVEAAEGSVNRRKGSSRHVGPLVISLRSLDSPLYNVDVILRAMALVCSASGGLPQARLWVAGDGRLRPGLERLAARLGLGESVRFLGHLPHKEIASLLAQAAVYVSVPSSDATSAALLEAMAVGCFPIASALPANGEWIEDGANGFLVPPGSPSSLAEAIVRALGDPQLRQAAAACNLELIRVKALWEENMAAMEGWYQRLSSS